MTRPAWDLAHVTQRQFVYTHRWRPHELVIWDNRCTMHRGTDYDDLRWVRDMRCITCSDVANTCEQEGVPFPDQQASNSCDPMDGCPRV